jgi:hypothetical protein
MNEMGGNIAAKKEMRNVYKILEAKTGQRNYLGYLGLGSRAVVCYKRKKRA